ncbi:unnamed protein product [Heterobilharzia americana]|nr:unnamed protein product [Heterobilharzia americana]
MKVTVCINDVKVVVPCGNGSILIRELAQMALLRFQKSTSSVFHTKNADQSNASCTSNSSKTAEQQHQSDQLYNLSIQRKVTHSDAECHLQQIDSKNVSWKLNIDDNEYEVDSLTLARDGGILDWDDRVVDVLDDRELLIVNFRKKLPNTPTVSSDTELHHSIYCQQTDVQEGLNSKNDHSTSDTNQLNKLVQSHFLSNDNNLTDSCVKNTLSCQTLSASLNSSSALTSSSSSSSSLPSYFQTVTSTLGKIICDTGVTYIQSHPILISSSQQLHQKSSNELISTESRELQQPPPPPQRYSNHRHISPSSLSENICINNICDCSLIKQGVIHNKHITGTNKVESGINKTNQYPTKLLTDYSQYNKHPVTTFIGGLEYELFSSRTPPVFGPPSFTSTETTTATSIMTKRQTSVCTASPTIHRASRPAPPPPPPPPPPHSSSSSTLPASLSLPPLAQPSVVDSKRTTLHHSIPNNKTITSINRPLITPNTQMNLSKTKMITDINDQDENKTTGVSSLMKKRIFDVDESKYNRPDHSQDAPQENITYNNCAPNVSCPPDSYLPQSMTDQYEFGDGILQSKSTLDLPTNIHHYHTTNTPLAFTTHTLSTHILPSSLLSSLDDYLLSNSLSSSLNTTDISIISNMNNNSLLMDTSFLSTVPEEDADMSELTSSNKTTPKQSPCKQVQLMKQLIHNNDAYSKSDYINDNEGIHSSPESSSPITVRRNLDGIHNHEADSFNCSSCQKCSDTNTEANSSSSPSKLSKDYSTSIQNIPDVHYHTRINRKQKRYRNSRAPAPPPPVTSSTASIEITPSRYQTKLPPPPPPPRSSRNDDTPYSSESDIDEQNYKNLYTFNRIHKVSDSSSSPNSINVEEMHRSPKSKSSVNRINTREYSQRGEDKRAFEQKFTSVTTCMSPSSSSSLSSGYKAETNHQHSNLTTLTSSCGQAVNTSLICPHCCEIQREKSNQLE